MQSRPLPCRPATRILAGVALTALAGCGSSGFDGAVFHGDGFAFRISARPQQWKPIHVSRAALVFRDTANNATIAVDGRCEVEGEDVPLAALTQHLFLRFSEREIIEQNVVPFDGREAMHTIVVAKLDGVPKKFDAWVLKKDGCVYDLYYIAPNELFDRGVGEFHRFVRGFATVPIHAK
jgi:hypothetical protein